MWCFANAANIVTMIADPYLFPAPGRKGGRVPGLGSFPSPLALLIPPLTMALLWPQLSAMTWFGVRFIDASVIIFILANIVAYKVLRPFDKVTNDDDGGGRAEETKKDI